MDILYEFDTIGIIYTAVVGGLFLLLFLPTILFAAKRKQTNPGTVFYRVLDIVLIVALAVLWFTYVLCHVKLFGLSVKPDGVCLALFSGSDPIFTIPNVGSIYGIFDSILGTVLLGLLSLMAILSLIFSFAFRRKKRVEDAETAEDNVESIPADTNEATEAVVFEPIGIELTDEDANIMDPVFTAVTEVAEDEVLTSKEEDLVAVEVLEEPEELVSEEFVPVEVLSEEPVHEEILTAEIQEDAPPKEISPAVKDAIRTVVLGTPQAVKDALKVVIEEDPLIVREVLRVIVDTPAMETPTGSPMTEPTENVEMTEEEPDVFTTAPEIPLPEFPFVMEEETAPISEPVREEEIAPNEIRVVSEPETIRSALAATTDEADHEPVAVVSLYAHVSNKTYSSSLRRPDTKKKSAATKEQA